MSKEEGEEEGEEEPKILFTCEPSDQNKSCSECQQDVRNIFFAMSICQYVSMSICQRSQKFYSLLSLSDQNKSCSECQEDVRNIFFAMSICQYVNMSECNFSAWVSK